MRPTTTRIERIERHGYVDDIHQFLDPNGRGHVIAVVREYERLAESIDFEADAPWVRWNRARAGMKL